MAASMRKGQELRWDFSNLLTAEKKNQYFMNGEHLREKRLCNEYQQHTPFNDINSIEISHRLRTLIHACLNYSTSKRPTAQKLLDELQDLGAKHVVPVPLTEHKYEQKSIETLYAFNVRDLEIIYNDYLLGKTNINYMSLALSNLDHIKTSTPYTPMRLFERLYTKCLHLPKSSQTFSITLWGALFAGPGAFINILCTVSNALDINAILEFLNRLKATYVVVDRGIPLFAWLLAGRRNASKNSPSLLSPLSKCFKRVIDIQVLRQLICPLIHTNLDSIMRFLGIKFVGSTESFPHSFEVAMEFVVFLRLFPLSLVRKVDNFIGGHPDVGIQFLNVRTRQEICSNFVVVLQHDFDWQRYFEEMSVQVEFVSIHRGKVYLRYEKAQEEIVTRIVQRTPAIRKLQSIDHLIQKPSKSVKRETDSPDGEVAKKRFKQVNDQTIT